jgi:2',3'-cyclic-nucleotide 2'-phosphodiesterase/3'-nucleotidase/5'-nucleotidase
MHRFARLLLPAAIAAAAAGGAPVVTAAPLLSFDLEWRHFASLTQGVDQSEVFDQSAAEIVVHDPGSQRAFVVYGLESRVDVLDATSGEWLGFLDLSANGSPNSVAVRNGRVAVAVAAPVITNPGAVVFFDAADGDIANGGSRTGVATVGALPDMVTFTPDGSKALVANEGEPNSGVNPVGSVSIIPVDGAGVPGSVTTADFSAFTRTALLASGVRLPDASVSAQQDLEPEYITVSPDGTKAYVSLQENNAIAEIDLQSAEVVAVRGLGTKDHSIAGNGFDASDRDDAIRIRNWQTLGMPMPDSIGSYQVNGQTYVVTANEGDARSEDARVEDLVLSDAFGDETQRQQLQQPENLGRLEVSSVDFDGTEIGTTGNPADSLYSYGTRSFSIFDEAGALIWDSGDAFERITADRYPAYFNSNNDDNTSFDSRSDAKGPEPEALVLGQVFGNTLAFIGLERIGGIMVYDITNPASPIFLDYLLDRDFDVPADTIAAGDLGPEGLFFVRPEDSPFGTFGLLVANEVSGTTAWYSIHVPTPAPLALFVAGLPLLALRRRRR